jgi:hypothetical protein
LLASTFRYAFDLLNLLNLEASVLAEVALNEKRYEYCPLGMCVNTAAGAAFEGCHEQRRASGGFEDLKIVQLELIKAPKSFLHNRMDGG